MKEVGSINVALKHLLSEATSKRHGEEKAQFDCFDKSYIWDFGNMQHEDYGKTSWHDPLSGIW